MSVLAKEVNYDQLKIEHGSYKYHKITPNVNIDEFSIGGGDVIEFHLPTSTLNLSKSILRYQCQIPDAAGANLSTKVHMSCLAGIRNIELITSSGKVLVTVPDIDKYTKMVWGFEKTTDVYENNAPATATTFANILGPVQGNYPQTGVAAAVDSVLGVSGRSYYASRKFLLNGAANLADSPSWEMQIPLRMLYDTLFAMPQDFYFGQSVMVRVTTQPSARFGFISTTATMANPAVLATVIEVQNVELHVAVQQNNIVQQSLIQSVNSESGFRLKIPYVYLQKQQGQGTSQNIAARMNQGSGQKLRKAYFAPFVSPETILNTYNHTSANLLSFDVFINSDKLNQQLLTPAIAYRENHERLKGTVMATNILDYTNHFVYEINFVDESHPIVMGDTMYSDGLPLTDTMETKLEIQCTTEAENKVNYLFSVLERELVIQGSNIDVL